MSKKLTLQHAQLAAKKKEGKCLSKCYVNSSTPMEWECHKGHKWKAIYSSVSTRTWCPVCAKANNGDWKKKSIIDAQKVAALKGGKVLSKSMNGVEQKLQWECSEGHRWRASYHMVKAESWCPKCSKIKSAVKRRKYSNADALKIIKKNNGVLISGLVETAQSLLIVRCSHGHEFKTNLTRLLRPNWCRICKLREFGGWNKKELSVAQDLAIQKGGKLISKEYVNSKGPLTWQCSKGHEWTSSYGSVKIHWCPKCQYEGNKTIASERFGPKSMKAARTYAKKRGGKLLTKEWPGTNKARMTWQCKEGHTWSQNLNSVLSRESWCPICRSWVKEHILKQAFEHLTGQEFPKIKVKWMRSPKGRPLELDGYSDNIKVAFEYNGPQHYKVKNHFRNNLNYIRECDKIKRTECKKRGIRLLIFRYAKQKDPIEIAFLVQKRLEKIGIPLVAEATNFKPNSATKNRLEKVLEIVDGKSGKLLDKIVIDSTTKISVRCAQGHIWKTTLTQLKLGKWCQECYFDKVRENPEIQFKKIIK